MQKFVKSHSHGTHSTEEQTSSLHPSQVKLVGYLKKKRTKVGGWRKMWFVLQNQLLLSYSSKEDYDRKLVSFKDVLNLVPGTVVRPLGGYRFAIQTTSESVFIFRCDDNKSYMEWITALVDSLSIGSKAGIKKTAVEEGMIKRPLQGSHSCSSLIRSKKNKPVQIPIVLGTARILNRTGLSENDLRAFSLRENSERSNRFCLHETQLLLQNQSNEVSRINRMFGGSAASDADASSTIHTSIIAAAGSGDKGYTQATTTATQNTMKAKLSGCKDIQCDSESSEVKRKSIINRKMHELLNFIKTDSLTMAEDKLEESDFEKDINSNRRYELLKVLQNESRHLNEETAIRAERNSRIEDQVQRLSLQGSSAFKIDEDKNVSTLDEEVNCLRLSSTIRTEERSPFARHRRRPEQRCSSLSDSHSSSVKTNESVSGNDNGSELSEDVGKKNEPIYAVVDLKNKYEHRARIRNAMEEKRKSLFAQMKDWDEVTTDYEEDQVQRLSLQGSSAFKIDEDKNVSTLDEEVNCLRLSSTIRTEERSPFARHRRRPEQRCSSLSDSHSSSVKTNESVSGNDNGSELSEDVGKKNEPIYAVVDLKNKYEHRARIRNAMEEKRKSLFAQMKDWDEVTTDYEEIFGFPREQFENNIESAEHCYDEENIYEPINIPEPSFRDHKHRNVLWKYISRFNIDALFEMARNRKRTVKPTEQTSPFANIRQKIGHHRKSLRIRMIKLYAREQQTPDDIAEKVDVDEKSDQE